MTEQSTFNSIPYPSEDEDPYYESFKGMVDNVDEMLIFERQKSSSFIVGGGTITFNASLNTLTWTEDIIIPLLIYGKVVKVKFGPDESTRSVTVVSGQALVVDLPASANQDYETTMYSVSQLTPANKAQYVIGFRYNNTVYLRNLGSF